MQIGAMNSVNFGNAYAYRNTDSEMDTAQYDKWARFSEKVKQIKSNVRPETCILTTAAIILAILKGKKIADIAARGLIVATSWLKAGTAKLGGNMSGAFKNLTVKNFDKTAHNQKVADEVKAIIDKGIENGNKIGVADEKFVSRIEEYSKTIFKENGAKISKFITENMGINSKSGALTAAAASVFGWKAGDGGGDVLENILDNNQIKNEFKKVMSSDAE